VSSIRWVYDSSAAMKPVLPWPRMVVDRLSYDLMA
jgi:hypothetical protein